MRAHHFELLNHKMSLCIVVEYFGYNNINHQVRSKDDIVEFWFHNHSLDRKLLGRINPSAPPNGF